MIIDYKSPVFIAGVTGAVLIGTLSGVSLNLYLQNAKLEQKYLAQQVRTNRAQELLRARTAANRQISAGYEDVIRKQASDVDKWMYRACDHEPGKDKFIQVLTHTARYGI